MARRIGWIGALLAAVALSTSLAVGQQGGMIGWRCDGTGVFGDLGIPKTFCEQEDLRWKTPLPHAGNGSPIVVNGRVLVVCEPGWPVGVPREDHRETLR